jgi:2-hydroxychromene-2-carboxylate isomerase
MGPTQDHDDGRQGAAMGDVISLEERRSARLAVPERRPARLKVAFFFDLGSPFTYLAAERVDRLFPAVTWRPALTEALHVGDPLSAGADREAAQQAAEERAAQLHLPLVWPDRFPAGASVAMRVAALAAEGGQAAPFVLAASRLAFCGGFDLDDPEVLAEAAAAAGLGLPEVLAAAGDRSRDGEMEATALRLLSQGATSLPVLRAGRTLFCGEHRIAEAAAAVRQRPRLERQRPTQVPNAG